TVGGTSVVLSRLARAVAKAYLKTRRKGRRRRADETEVFFAPKSASLGRRLPFLDTPWPPHSHGDCAEIQSPRELNVASISWPLLPQAGAAPWQCWPRPVARNRSGRWDRAGSGNDTTPKIRW